MKNKFILLLSLIALACNNDKTASGATSDTTLNKTSETVEKKDKDSPSTGSCGSLYIFKKGTVVETASYDADGKETSRQTSTVLNVSNEAGKIVSEMEMKNVSEGVEDKTFIGKYSCDGKNLYIDLTSLFAGMGKEGATIEGDAITFPISISNETILPDASYSITMTQGGKKMKITSYIKERKVEGREKVTTAAGTFNCYKVTALSDAKVEIEDMDEKTKQMMDAMKKTMPKQRFVMYFDPAVSIVKVELFSDDKLISHSDVISIQ